MFPQVSAPQLTTGPALARAPTAASPPPALAPQRPSGRLAHWRAAAFSIFADDQAQGPFSLWPRDMAKAAARKAPASGMGKKKEAKAVEADVEDVDVSAAHKPKMHFRSALEQVSYYTNESAFQRRE